MTAAVARYVVGFVFASGLPQHVLLLRKDTEGKEGVHWMDGMWNGLGGKVEDGESAAEAMDREGLEELGLDLEWEHVATLTDGRFQLDVCRAWVERFSDTPEVNDVGELFHWHPVNNVVHQRLRTIPNLQWLVPMCMGADSAFYPFTIHQPVVEPTP